MQIVRDLGGYTLGRSDLVRRAMSKKKASVMAKERQNFVYGNKEEAVPGCIANGISEQVANKIYDDMTDFAKYAFNKSHAAAYAVVSYQTAWLKYYYPVEFMAALMTSVMDNPGKVAEYIMVCRQMGIQILPPDINEGEGAFSVKDGKIRYGLSAIKSIGRPVIEAIVKERERGGRFTDLKNFAERLSGREVNKRTVEGFIKAGALDSLGGTRKQQMMIYVQIMDGVAQEKKAAISGQMSLFDLMGEEEKKEYAVQMPNVGEYEKSQLLAMEKEVLGIYASGHPLEEYETMWRRNISAVSSDFVPDEDLGQTKAVDGSKAIIGGIVEGKTIKYTKKNQTMAFFSLEDLLGTVEVVVFPQMYEKYHALIQEDNKVFVQGRVAAEDERASKLICEKIWAFEEVSRDLWIQFETKEAFAQMEQQLYQLIYSSDGKDQVVIYVKNPKAIKRLGDRYSIRITPELVQSLETVFGKENVKVTEGKK